MYCKTCGSYVNDNYNICTKCGLSPGQGNNYCANCGNQIFPQYTVCASCGHPTETNHLVDDYDESSSVTDVEDELDSVRNELKSVKNQLGSIKDELDYVRRAKAEEENKKNGTNYQIKYDHLRNFSPPPEPENKNYINKYNDESSPPVKKDELYDLYYGKRKSKSTAFLLALLLGIFGAHDFYVGRNKQGIIKLLCSSCSCGALIPAMAVWTIADIVNIMTEKIDINADSDFK